MPQMGESLAEGTIVRWLKAVGDRVAKDEPLFEISTDKVDTDVPSPVDGVLREILVQEGETVTVGAPVARLSSASDSVSAAEGEQSEGGGSAAASPEPGGHFKDTHAARLVSFRDRRSPPAAGESASAVSAADPAGRDRTYSPAVLEAARRSGLPLGTLTTLNGSGRGGRLTKRDVERFLRERPPAAGAPAAGVTVGGEVPPAFVYRPGPGDERVPMSPVRRQIAHHMTWSARISPHATAFTEVDMSGAAELLRSRRARFEREVGSPLTYTVLVSQAAVAALADFRTLNASVVGDSLILKPSVHLGLAVALPDTEELIVPVVRRANELSIAGLARAIDDLARRARARRLQFDDVQGGTFTLTNPGMFGGIAGTPILHQPQVAILGLGSITKRPVVVDDAIGIRPIVVLSLTFDHRAADGMVAFRYLDAVKQRLEAGPDDVAWA
jgi:pyruvate/2-oxoglutarate dehydrogenase complex dihydrolipoamide acyltransferase (E2) component